MDTDNQTAIGQFQNQTDSRSADECIDGRSNIGYHELNSTRNGKKMTSQQYPLAGNVCELKNILKHAVVMSEKNILDAIIFLGFRT